LGRGRASQTPQTAKMYQRPPWSTMNASSLAEYQQSEWNHVNETLSQLHQGGFKEAPSHGRFYPEFKQKTESKVVANALNAGLFGSLLLQLPFYDAVVVPVMALQDEAAFAASYGLSVDELMWLNRKGKVLLVLDSQPDLYAGLDYLDPILETRPPSIQIREFGFNNYASIFIQDLPLNKLLADPRPHILQRMKFWDEYVHSVPWVENFASSAARAVLPSKDWAALAAAAGIPLTETVYQLTSWDYDLTRAGYSELVRDLVQSSLPKMAQVAALFTMRDHLAAIPAYAMDGVISTDETAWPWSFYRSHGVKEPEHSAFPVDIAKQLRQRFPLLDIRPLGADSAIDIASDTSKARRALFELQDAVGAEDVHLMGDRAEAVAEKIHEANLTMESMAATKRQTKRYLPMVLGVLGVAIGGLAVLPTLVTGMFGSFVSTVPIGDKVGSILAKRGKPRYVIALYDLQQSMARGND